MVLPANVHGLKAIEKADFLVHGSNIILWAFGLHVIQKLTQ
jgi:hypothetical protein